MPLKRGASKPTISNNISKLLDEGESRRQAIAESLQRARDTARKGQKRPPPPPKK